MDFVSWKKNYACLWIGQALELIETSITNFALSWYYADVTGSATILSTISAVSQLPQILLSPFAGVVVDRFDRRKILMLTDFIVAITFFILGLMFQEGDAPLIFVYIMVFITASCSAFAVPALQASIPLIVPKASLTRMISLGQIITAIPSLIGPLAGAVLIQYTGMSTILFISAGIALLAIVPLLFASVPRPVPSQTPTASYWQDLQFGLRYLWKWKALLAIVLIGSLCNFLIMPPSQLLPLVVSAADASADLYAAAQVMMVLGLALTAVFMSIIKKKQNLGHLLAFSQLGLGLSVLLIWTPALPILPRLLIAGGLLGVFAAMYNVSAASIVAAEVEPSVQGRVMSVSYSLLALASPISLSVAGPTADAVGLGPVYLFCGATLLFMGIIIYRLPLFHVFTKTSSQEVFHE